MAYLDKKTLGDEYEETKDHHRRYFDYFDEYERLARNIPSDKIAKNLPKVTDGTLAAIVQEQPKRIIQQIPTGSVNCEDYPLLAEVAGYVLANELLPQANTQGSVLQKSWIMANKALIYGMQASYTFFSQTAGRFHTDFIIPYIKDILIEKGKVYGPDSNKLFMRSWYTKSDLKRIIEEEDRLSKQDKSYKSTWDLKKLAQLQTFGDTKENEDKTPFEREKGISHGGIEIIHCFQNGIANPFYSYAPAMGKKNESGEIIREWTNPDPRGKMPIDFMYCNVDLSNPYGRGAVEISGGVQNLIDHQMVMFQFMTTLMAAPPLQVWGNLNRSTLKYEPNAIWDMGAQQSSRADPLNISNSSINNFPTNYGLLKSQILNINSSLDSSVSAESGNPGFSKTPAGIQNNQQRLSISDNYLRKQFEKWFSDMSETSINIFFSEMEGNGELVVPEDKLAKLTPEALKEYLDPKTDKIRIPYSDISETVFKFEVDASSSEVKDKSDNAEKLTELLRIAQNILSDEQKYRLVKQIGKEVGAEGIDEIFPDINSLAGREEQQAQAMQQMTNSGQETALVGKQVPNSPEAQPQNIQAGQTLQASAQQPVPQAQEPSMVEQLLAMGYSEDEINQVLGEMNGQ